MKSKIVFGILIATIIGLAFMSGCLEPVVPYKEDLSENDLQIISLENGVEFTDSRWTMEKWNKYQCDMCHAGEAYHPIEKENVVCGDFSDSCYCEISIKATFSITYPEGVTAVTCTKYLDGKQEAYSCGEEECSYENSFSEGVNEHVIAGTISGARIDEEHIVRICCKDSFDEKDEYVCASKHMSTIC